MDAWGLYRQKWGYEHNLGVLGQKEKEGKGRANLVGVKFIAVKPHIDPE
jgi:hypothetical protein